MKRSRLQVLTSLLTGLAMLACLLMPLNAQDAEKKPQVAPATEKGAAEKPASEKPKQPEKKPRRSVKLSEDTEEALPDKDPTTYQLSNKKLVAEYTGSDTAPYDRGEHVLISAFMGGIGGAVVGGMIGLAGFNQYDETKTLNTLYTAGGVGAALGVASGIAVTFFERGKIEQFAIGKFLLKYSWYGAIGGGVLGAGVGFIPYSSSGDYSDIMKYAGYGAGIGLAAGLVLFFIDIPDHLKLYSYRRDDQTMIQLALRF